MLFVSGAWCPLQRIADVLPVYSPTHQGSSTSTTRGLNSPVPSWPGRHAKISPLPLHVPSTLFSPTTNQRHSVACHQLGIHARQAGQSGTPKTKPGATTASMKGGEQSRIIKGGEQKGGGNRATSRRLPPSSSRSWEHYRHINTVIVVPAWVGAASPAS